MIRAGEHADMFIKCSQETMLIQGPTPLDIRKIHSYPSCAKTLRGCGGDVVYMEEVSSLLPNTVTTKLLTFVFS